MPIRSCLKYKHILLIILALLITIIVFGAKRTKFVETGNITKEIIRNKQKYLLPDSRGLDYVLIKSNIYNKIRPRIVAIGSSRVLQFRESFFSKSFYNMGYTVGDIPAIKATVNHMDKSHRPDLIIVGIDFWWFLKNYTLNPVYSGSKREGLSIKGILKYIFYPYFLWIKNESNLAAFIESFYSPKITSDSRGTIHDGSFLYFDIIDGSSPHDVKFRKTEKRVHDCTSPFFSAREISKEHVEAFITYAKELQAIARHVVYIMPPISNYIYRDMKSNENLYPHVFLLKKMLEDKGIRVFDYTDPLTVNSSDCEMIDGFHGGEITYARLMLDLARKDPEIQYAINAEYLSDSVKKFNGYAMIPDTSYFNGREVDFLELNCKK